MSKNKRKRMDDQYELSFKPLNELQSHNQPTMPSNPNLLYIILPPGVDQEQDEVQEILTLLMGDRANPSECLPELHYYVSPNQKSTDRVTKVEPMGTMKWKTLFRCAFPGCRVTFPSLYEQKIHFNTHMLAASTEFKCSICGMLFDRATDRNKHVDSHSIVHTYKCKLCKKSFPYYTSLLKHMNEEKCAVSKAFSCNFCGVQFLDVDDLEKHQKVNMKLCPFRANICGEQVFKLHQN